MYKHNPVQHCRYLKQALAHSNAPIGFFISAGCPLGIKMPKGKWPLIPDVRGLTAYIDKKFIKNEKYQVLLKELKLSGKKNYHIEDILTFIRSLKDVSAGGTVRGLTEDELSNLEEIVCKEIGMKVTVDLPEGDTPYSRLANWIQSIEREVAIEIFTTNYDLLMEQAFENSYVPYFDGFVGSNKSFFDLRSLEQNEIPKHWTRLWKIHGSLNWYIEKESKDIYRGLYNADVSKTDLHLIYPSHLKYDKSRKMPFLALIDQLRRFISKKDSVLILSGYSFNDEHLNEVIVNTLKSTSHSSVFALLFGELNNYPNAIDLASKCSNLSLYASDEAIIGTTRGEWNYDEELVELDTSMNELISITDSESGSKKYSFDIGNFDNFTLFLKYLISEDKAVVKKRE